MLSAEAQAATQIIAFALEGRFVPGLIVLKLHKPESRGHGLEKEMSKLHMSP